MLLMEMKMGNRLEIDDLKDNDLLIEVKDGIDNSIDVFFIGKIYMLNPTELVGTYLDELHDKLILYSIKNVTVNFYNLKLLNSSGLKTIIKWFKTNASLENHYNIKLYYNKSIDWQETSLAMLTELFPLTIEKIPL
jgi:hypothetical protein